MFKEDHLLDFYCAFRKVYSAQHYLLGVIEKWKIAVDNGKVFGTLLIDLSTTFDCSSHKLITAQINAFGLT